MAELAEIWGNNLIEQRTSEAELNARLDKGISDCNIPGEQWFRKPDNWYSITAYANPYKTPHGELKLMYLNEALLAELLDKTKKVFYGVGVGETETVPVEWDLKKRGYSEVYAIDAVDRFLDGFVQSLRNLSYTHPKSKLMFRAYCDLFENTGKTDFGWGAASHICLGNTIGNFEYDEIFGIFGRNMAAGDKLVLGVQLDKDVDALLSQYANNPRFETLLRDSLQGKLDGDITWRYNKSASRIEALISDTIVFKSRKFKLSELMKAASRHSFSPIEQLVEGDAAVVVLERG